MNDDRNAPARRGDRAADESSRPHLVMLVGNAVVGDSRVEKSAESARRSGYRVTVVGVAQRGHHGVDLLGRVPLLRIRPTWRRYNRWQSLLRTGAYDHMPAAALARQADVRLSRRLAPAATDPGASAKGDAWSGGRATRRYQSSRVVDSLLRRRRDLGLALMAATTRLPAPGVWRRAFPLIADLEDEFLHKLLDLCPDLVHAHDVHALPAVARYVQLQRALGRRVPWVYDAHEWLPGQSIPGPAVVGAAWRRVELEFARRADSVVTVGEDLADMLQERHRLPRTPAVVTNAPLQDSLVPAAGRERIREEIGLDTTTPLLVYSGKAAARRGVQTAVQALPDLPGVHLAVITAREPVPRAVLADLARQLGVADRVHIVEYVPAESITWYLSSATVGLSPLTHNSAHHSAVATKVREYLHAGLPVVVSDCRAQQRFVTATAVGEVHVAEDVRSFAAAVEKVLADLGRYRAALTPELLRSNSWQQQEETLRSVWTSLVPAGTAPVTTPGLVVGPVDSRTPGLAALGQELARSLGCRVDVVTHDPTAGAPGLRLSAGSTNRPCDSARDLSDLVGGADCAVIAAFSSLVPGIFQGTAEEVSTRVRTGQTVAVAVHETDVASLADLEAAGVHVPAENAENADRERWDRRVRINRRHLTRLEVPVLVIGSMAPTPLVRGILVPRPVDVPDAVQTRPAGPLTVRVVDGTAHLHASTVRLVEEVARGGNLITVDATSAADVVLVPGTGVHGPDALTAVAAGSLVLAVVDAGATLPPGLPVDAVTPADLQDRLAGLADARSSSGDGPAAAGRARQRAWVKEHHDVSVGAGIVTGTLRAHGASI